MLRNWIKIKTQKCKCNWLKMKRLKCYAIERKWNRKTAMQLTENEGTMC